MKIGFILPQSMDFPFLGKEFQKGFELLTSDNKINKLIYYEVEKGEPKEVIKAFRKLIINEEVDLIIGFLESFIVPDIKDLINATQIPCIITGMGARLPIPKALTSSYIHYHTYQTWESNWMVGNRFIKDKTSSFAALSSFFDSGFPSVYACVQGYSGGCENPAFISITHNANFENEWGQVKKLLTDVNPEYIYLSYFGREREEIIDKLISYGISTTKLISSSSIGGNNTPISRITSWHPLLDNKENIDFVNLYVAKYKKNPSEFSLLGYELYFLVTKAIGDNENVGNNFCNQLINGVFYSPRGKVSFIPETNSSYVSHYLIQGNDIESYPYPKHEVVEEIGKNSVTNQIGWHNTYLCK